MLFATAIGGRLHGKEQEQAQADTELFKDHSPVPHSVSSNLDGAAKVRVAVPARDESLIVPR